MIDGFIEYLKSHIGDAYVWGSQGENVSAMSTSVRDAWIKRKETTAANAQRAINYCNRSNKNPLYAFDCSGLITKFLLEKKIIKADKNSHALYSDSEPIAFSQLQAGDFVFRHNGSRVYHIGVYIGGNMVIEAKGRDDGVVCRNLSANGYNYWNRAGHYKPLFDAQDNIVPVRQDEFYAKCAGEKVNVRVGAGTNYSSICKLSKNAKMLALPAVNGWCKIAFCENNELKTGFMYSQYVQKSKRKITASKKYVYISFLLAICVTLYAMIICPFFGDFITIQYLLTVVYGNLATSLGFYFNKAKKENCQGGITYDAVMQNIEKSDNDAQG